MVLFRQELGELLREKRQARGRSLRELSTDAAVSFGYLSEIERGTKEASSELLSAICEALDVPLSVVLADLSERVARAEAVTAPVPLPVGPRAPVRVNAA